MHTIIPLHKVDRQTVRDMAQAAASNGQPAGANPFPQDDPKHHHWNHDFHQFHMEFSG